MMLNEYKEVIKKLDKNKPYVTTSKILHIDLNEDYRFYNVIKSINPITKQDDYFIFFTNDENCHLDVFNVQKDSDNKYKIGLGCIWDFINPTNKKEMFNINIIEQDRDDENLILKINL